MYVCRLGVICSLLSDTLVSGFTAGAAMHVFTSQIKDIFGFQIASHSGMFQNVFVSAKTTLKRPQFLRTLFNKEFELCSQTYIEIFKHLDTINWVATVVSVITIFILVFNNSFLKVSITRYYSHSYQIMFYISLCMYVLHFHVYNGRDCLFFS